MLWYTIFSYDVAIAIMNTAAMDICTRLSPLMVSPSWVELLAVNGC